SRCRGHGDGGLPRYEIPMNAALADETIEALSARGFAPSFALNPKPDHAFVTPLHLLTPAMNIPIVPIFQNCNAPPLPPFKRCFELGAALRKIIEASENCSRVAVIGTGGVSHEVPVPDWRTVIRSGESSPWLEHMQGQGEQVREAITREILEWSQQGRGRINEIFDRWFLQAIKRRDYSTLSSLTFDTIDREAGNGAQELRNWLTM
ncbi:MAG: hypothetical protein ACREP6_15245, partial [Candidatus Binataceae bacterium]